jgi:hypothetical protein
MTHPRISENSHFPDIIASTSPKGYTNSSTMSSNNIARIAKIQIYDSSSNDFEIGLSEKLWDELIKETVEDESEGIFLY